MITLGEWVRKYGLAPFDVTAEEIAYGVIERKGLIASPELLLSLKALVEVECGDHLGPSRGINPIGRSST